MAGSMLLYWVVFGLITGAYLVGGFYVIRAALRSLVQPEGRFVYFIGSIVGGSILTMLWSLLFLLPLDWLATGTGYNAPEHFIYLVRAGLALNLILALIHTIGYRKENGKSLG